MTNKYHFKVYRYCPKEQIFDGMMTFTEARRFADQHASDERRVDYEVFNEAMHRWERMDSVFIGGRKVYDRQGDLYTIDADYRNMWKDRETNQ